MYMMKTCSRRVATTLCAREGDDEWQFNVHKIIFISNEMKQMIYIDDNCRQRQLEKEV